MTVSFETVLAALRQNSPDGRLASDEDPIAAMAKGRANKT